MKVGALLIHLIRVAALFGPFRAGIFIWTLIVIFGPVYTFFSKLVWPIEVYTCCALFLPFGELVGSPGIGLVGLTNPKIVGPMRKHLEFLIEPTFFLVPWAGQSKLTEVLNSGDSNSRHTLG